MISPRAEGVWLKRTGCACKKDRGFLGRENSRMEFQENEFGFCISQDKPMLFSPSMRSSMELGHGWPAIRGRLMLDACRKHQLARNSSIRLFLLSFFTFGGVMANAQSTGPANGRVGPNQQDQQIKKIGDSFETMMLVNLYEQMDAINIAGDSHDNPFAATPTEKLYKSWLTQEVMAKVSQSRPLKIGDLVEDQLRGKNGIRQSPAVK